MYYSICTHTCTCTVYTYMDTGMMFVYFTLAFEVAVGNPDLCIALKSEEHRLQLFGEPDLHATG